jgi:RHH-type transcriptional regulator, proline utilization regulon repressor / proline dehydrogenase / delta 1-pyrroline-5-carboxylate dehydrogenase
MSAAAALDMGPIDLPGPTGESNRLSLKPRGLVLCLGPSADAVLDQTVQALRCGNRVLAIAPDAVRAVAPLVETSLPVVAIDGQLAHEALEELTFDAVALEGGGREARRALSRRTGPIVPIIDERIVPHAYAHERAICIDVTAAGGNTALLALAQQ